MENRGRFKQDILKRMLELATKLVKEEEVSSTIPQGKYSIHIHKYSKIKMGEQIKPKIKENMDRVKPPYKFKSPYWTHDQSESTYYKACTLNLPSYMAKVLDLYREEYKKFNEEFERKLIYGN